MVEYLNTDEAKDSELQVNPHGVFPVKRHGVVSSPPVAISLISHHAAKLKYKQ